MDLLRRVARDKTKTGLTHLATADQISSDAVYFILFRMPDDTRLWEWFNADAPLSVLWEFLGDSSWKLQPEGASFNDRYSVQSDGTRRIQDVLRADARRATRCRYTLRLVRG
jgi:hypothetical protein